jgi:putative DNA primase/helicase
VTTAETLPADTTLLDLVQMLPPAPIRRGIADSQLYRYRDGKWDTRGEDEVQARLLSMFSDGFEAAKIRNVRYLMRGIEPTMPGEPPEESKYLVNCRNGVVNVTGQRPTIEAHDPDHLFRYIIPHDYDPNASCPVIDEALANMFPDPDMVRLVHEIYGYCLLPGFSLKKAILLYSREPNTGKSTMLNLLGSLVGHANEATVSLQDLDDHKFARASLQDKLLNRSGDLGAYAPRSSSNFKSLVGGDPVLAEHKGQQQFSLVNTAKLFFAGNSFAGTHESGAAYSTRWLVVPFTVVHQARPDFLRSVTTERELQGLLKHAIDGAARLVSNNAFTRPVAVEDAEYALQIETDSVARYVKECLTYDSSATLPAPQAFKDYQEWAKDGGMKYPVERRNFYTKIADLPGVEIMEQRARKKVIVGLRSAFPGNTTVEQWKVNREHGI